MRARRAAVAERYNEAFIDLPVRLPAPAAAGDSHAWHLYVLRLDDEAPLSRDSFIEEMAQAGVGCSVHFIPLHKQPYWRHTYSLQDGALPVASREFDRVVSLPIFSGMDEGQVERVIAATRRLLT